jgi:hypothetical protein
MLDTRQKEEYLLLSSALALSNGHASEAGEAREGA